MIDNKKSFFSPVKAWKYLLKKPVTIDKKLVFDTPREASDRYRGFHTNDWDKCIGCGTCSEICPTEAINMIEILDLEKKDGEKPEKPAFDYGRCSFCALCVDICTSDSLGMSKEYIHLSTDANSFYFLPEQDGIHQLEMKNGYERDDISELLDLKRYQMDHVDALGRKDSFIEIVKGFSAEMAKAEASRCVACEVCTATCPAHMNIPEYIEGIYRDDLKTSVKEIYKTNPLPGTCGSICTHKCEGACSLGVRGEAIAIRWLKRYAVDHVEEADYKEAVMSHVAKQYDGKVAVIGAGPSGLSAAFYLQTIGYDVTVFEEKPLAGGVARYGIPRYRLPDDRLDKDIKFMEEVGITFKMNTRVGRDVTMEELKEDFDAVFIGAGYTLSRGLRIPGSEAEGVRYAMDFLAKARDYAREMGPLPDVAEKVVVVGGGNVAFDVARTLVRLQEIKYGKSHVEMAALEAREALPADLEEILEGEEEGIHYNFGYGPQTIEVKADGSIDGLKTWKVKSIFDEEGRFNPSFDQEDERLIKADQVYIAIGQMQDFSFFTPEMEEKVEVNRGKVKVLPGGQIESLPWLFAGGDIVKGPDVINGIATGHDAAKAIDAYLQQQ